VTPTVLDNDLIRLQIEPEFSVLNPAANSGGTLGTDVRRVSTTVQLREGQTIAIAGLISFQQDTEVNRIPWLGELPFIGPTFFNTKRSSEDETELLILVTPELIRPMEPDEVPPLPGHQVTPPSDFELYRYAMSEGAPDTGVYQMGPYGSGASHAVEVPFRIFNHPSSLPVYSPVPSLQPGWGANPGAGGATPMNPQYQRQQLPSGSGGPYPQNLVPQQRFNSGPGTYPTPMPVPDSQSAGFGFQRGQLAPASPNVTNFNLQRAGAFQPANQRNFINPLNYFRAASQQQTGQIQQPSGYQLQGVQDRSNSRYRGQRYQPNRYGQVR
jgi:pilus assembly protein CpaC